MARSKTQIYGYENPGDIRARKLRYIVTVVLVLSVAAVLFVGMNQIQSVKIYGNEYYTEKEIKDLIIDTPLEHNALYLYWQYEYAKNKEIPFIDTVEIKFNDLGKIEITVYEKGIIGVVEYLGNYMYFDKEGIIVESSKKKMDNIPQITGLSFENLALYEELPVENSKIFNSILTLTQMLKKNEITPDGIHFDNDMNITLKFDDVKVMLGYDENLEAKIARLKYLMEDLKGRKGILHLENFNEDTKNITFENT